jgi:lysophospholipase L1-like esterase
LRKIFIPVLIILLIELSLRAAGQLYLSRLHYNNFINTVKSSPQDIIIVCLGESTTVGWMVYWDYSYPKQLERRLREFYKNDNIKIIVPPHMGHNTSVISNQLENYFTVYKPKLVILMVGANNQWSLSESHIVKFLQGFNKDVIKIRFLIFLDSLRLFKVVQYFYLVCTHRATPMLLSEKKLDLLWESQLSRWPPEGWMYPFAMSHKDAFIKLWEYDVNRIISETKKHNVKVVLMTYAVPIYVPFKLFVSMAKENNIGLIRNDQSFRSIIKSKGNMQEYFCQDNWHPNAKGYSIIANNVFEYIRDNDLLGLGNVPKRSD